MHVQNFNSSQYTTILEVYMYVKTYTDMMVYKHDINV